MNASRALLTLLLAVAPLARAADAPLLGKTLRLRSPATPAKRSATFVLAGAIDLAGVDPTQNGAVVTLANDGEVYTATLALTADHWTKAKGKPSKPPIYKYAEHDKVTGRAVSAKLVGGKMVKVSARGPQLPALGNPLGSVSISVTSGTLNLCGLFGGKIKKDDGSKFLASKAPAPSECPAGPTNFPTPPVLGNQIDRDGRPGISGIIVAMYAGLSSDLQAKDDYNHAASPAGWAGSFVGSFETALGMWDGVDNVCGNQIGADAVVSAARYQTFASVLVDDRLYVDTAIGTCTIYLGVEQALSSGTDCGGRPPGTDVVDITYSLLTIGQPSGVGDGVTNDNLFSTTFPFLNAPNN